MPVPNRARNKDGRFRKKRRDAHDYKEREKQRPLPISDPGQLGAYSLSEEVVAKIQERVEKYSMKRKEETEK